MFTAFSLHFQLKATSRQLAIVRASCAHDLEVHQYDKLRATEVVTPRFMILFELPDSAEEWLNVSAEQLIARRCARWLSLRGAPATANTATIAVHVPMNNVLTPDSLREIATRVSLGEVFEHDA